MRDQSLKSQWMDEVSSGKTVKSFDDWAYDLFLTQTFTFQLTGAELKRLEIHSTNKFEKYFSWTSEAKTLCTLSDKINKAYRDFKNGPALR